MNHFNYEEASSMLGSGSNIVLGNKGDMGASIKALTIKRPSESFKQVVDYINASTANRVVGYTFVNKFGKKCTVSTAVYNRMQKLIIEDAGATDIKPIYAGSASQAEALKWATAGSYEESLQRTIGGY